MAATGDGLESKDLQTMISDRNETAEMMVKRVWPRVDSWKVQWSKKLTSMRFKVRWHDDSTAQSLTAQSLTAKRPPRLQPLLLGLAADRTPVLRPSAAASE